MNRVEVIVNEQFEHVSKIYSGLNLVPENQDIWHVQGNLHFRANFDDEIIDDRFEIDIEISDDYPDSPPRVKETGGRIPKSFHHYQNDFLCLGTPIDVKIRFVKNPTLLGFIENILVHYLYSYCFQEKHSGVMPFGEQPHGGEGIIAFYRDLFKVEEINSIMGLLRILTDNLYRGIHDCPCNSGKKLNTCHGPQIKVSMSIQKPSQFLVEYAHAYHYCKSIGINLSRDCRSKRLIKLLEHRDISIHELLTKGK